ncbi:MAG: hypothetical protein AB7Q97_21230 [Gammaproteobacteria bacterium]
MKSNDQVRSTRAAFARGAGWLMLLVLCLPRAFAHSDEYFDSRPSAHGGQTRMAGPVHIELVRGTDELTLYVTDHADRPQITAGGQAALRFPAQDVRVDLKPDGENRFTAPWPAGVPRDAVAVAFVRLADAAAQSATFDPAAIAHRDHARTEPVGAGAHAGHGAQDAHAGH